MTVGENKDPFRTYKCTIEVTEGRTSSQQNDTLGENKDTSYMWTV